MQALNGKIVLAAAVAASLAAAGAPVPLVANPAAAVVEKPALTLDGARRVIAAALAEAGRRGTTGVIAVVDDGGNLMAVERIDGTFGAGANVSIGKARTAALFKKPTRAFEEIIAKGRTAMVALPDFTPLQGGIPLLADGQVVGGVGVSGAASAQEDEELALAGAAALGAGGAMTAMPGPSGMAGMADTAAAPVLYFAEDQVAAAFAKGAVLVDGAGGRNYMVHASRREGAGEAEVHAQDTDVIYVLGGGATFVTGGTVVDGRETAPGEVRGASIEGGETRVLSPGDVIVVPHGVPHWFQRVEAPFTYYVVKVRR